MTLMIIITLLLSSYIALCEYHSSVTIVTARPCESFPDAGGASPSVDRAGQRVGFIILAMVYNC